MHSTKCLVLKLQIAACVIEWLLQLTIGCPMVCSWSEADVC